MRKVLVVVGILVVVVLGFWFLSNMTGSVITGAVIGNEEIVEVEDFRISDFGEASSSVPSDEGKINEKDLNGTQNSTGQG